MKTNKSFAILSSIIIGGVGGATLTIIFSKSIIIISIVSLLCIMFMLYSNPKLSERKDNIHYSLKPIELMDILVRGFCTDGYKLIDPFMGTGPISKVIKPLNIDYYGIEKEKDFYEYSIKSL